MPKLSKTRGTGYEYRIAKWFSNEKQTDSKPKGWEAERNSLSREEKSFGKTTAKHDVKAWKDVDEYNRIFLQIEAKKTAKDIHTIQKEWIDKIDFKKDELLVIALNRTAHYAVLDIMTVPALIWGSDEEIILPEPADLKKLRDSASKTVKCRGKKSVRVHKKDVEEATLEAPMILNWENIEREFCIFPLFDYVRLREQRPPNVKISPHDIQPESDDESDIPTVEVEIEKETTISCPYDGLPIRLVPKTN